MWIKVGPIVKDGFLDEQAVNPAVAWMGIQLDELRDLCKDSSLFGGDDLFLLVHGLLGSLIVFHGVLKQDATEALELWETKTADSFKRTSSKLSQAIDRIMRKIRDFEFPYQ